MHPRGLASVDTMGVLIDAHDWSGSPLGEPGSWPQPLRIVVGILLAANQPMFVAWGPTQATIYNDAYGEILGSRHPAALGRPFFEIWPEVTRDVGPILARAFAGEPIYMDNIDLILNRDGRPAEAHFSFFYAPVRDEAGEVRGVFCACTETTEQIRGERERREAEARNRQILDSAVDYAIIATDLDGRVTRWNEGARRVLGWSADEMLGQSIEAIFTPEDHAEARAATEMRLSVETGVGNDERWHVRRSGERFWATGEMTPLRDETGDLVGFVKVLRDRTEQRLAESRLRESERRFRGLAEATPGFVWTADPDGMVTYASSGWHAYAGTDPGEATAIGWALFVHPDDRGPASGAWSRALSSGTLYETEFRLRAADGSHRWWLARALPTRDEDGAISFWAGICTDIEAIVGAREALARSREQLETLVAERTAERNRIWRLSRDLLVVIGADGIFRAVNPAWSAILGHDPAEVVGRSFLDFVWPDDAALTERRLEGAVSERNLTSFENRYRHRDGTPRSISWHSSLEGGLVYGYGRDITTEKAQAETLRRTEEALRQSQKMEAVGQLTGGLAHDFNNLLTGITGSLELMRTRLAQGRLDALDRYITTAQGAASRAASLTHRLLAFSRRQTLDARPTDVNRLVAGMEDLISRTVGPAITVDAILADDLAATLCDPNQLENAILNLCINARDAMAEGGRLTLETANVSLDGRAARERDMAPGHYVEVRVSDTGQGMTPEIAERAFDPFFTTKPIGQGTGLGLSMIYGFAKQSGGQVRLHTAPGLGTTMRILLPRHAGATPVPPPNDKRAEVPRADAGETVLVVDDEAAIRMLVMEVLEELGYLALEAIDAASGLVLLRSDARIDLLITDVGLPGALNGRQMADAARLGRPDLDVLFITGYAENALVSRGHLEPGMHVLTKPFTMETLATRIRTILG